MRFYTQAPRTTLWPAHGVPRAPEGGYTGLFHAGAGLCFEECNPSKGYVTLFRVFNFPDYSHPVRHHARALKGCLSAGKNQRN
jgi:hypothetical protein